MQIALNPNPTEAILHGAPCALRSLIRPFAGFASFQKKLKAPCWIVSRRASVVGCADAPATAIKRKTSMNDFFIFFFTLEENFYSLPRITRTECFVPASNWGTTLFLGPFVMQCRSPSTQSSRTSQLTCVEFGS